MGDEWRQMAESIGLTAPVIQRIISKSQDGASEGAMVKDMLLAWYKTAKSSTDKVNNKTKSMQNNTRTTLPPRGGNHSEYQ